MYEPNSIQKRNLTSELPRRLGAQAKSQQGNRSGSNDNGLSSQRTRAKLGKTQDMDGEHYTMHMQLLKNILKDHTLQEIVLNGSDELDSGDQLDSDDDSDEEPIVIKMIASQMARKKSVKESLEMTSDIPVEQIKQELKRLIRRQQALDKRRRHALEEDARMDFCS